MTQELNLIFSSEVKGVVLFLLFDKNVCLDKFKFLHSLCTSLKGED